MIDKIINEWTYQLDSGYPTKESDYEVLRSVLQEMNILSEQEIDQTIRIKHKDYMNKNQKQIQFKYLSIN